MKNPVLPLLVAVGLFLLPSLGAAQCLAPTSPFLLGLHFPPDPPQPLLCLLMAGAECTPREVEVYQAQVERYRERLLSYWWDVQYFQEEVQRYLQALTAYRACLRREPHFSIP